MRIESREKIVIGSRSTMARGTRYLTEAELQRQVSAGLLEVVSEGRDKQGGLHSVQVRRWDYVESDAAVVNRVLGKDISGKQNILVFNDEAHHAYRIHNEHPDNWDEMEQDEHEDWLAERNEATVWVDGLDRIHKYRGINFCVDLSATPYFLGRVEQETNKIFPWVVSDFGLTDAIESGLTKIPQLVVSDPTGKPLPSYFNIWRWLMTTQLTPAEKGGKKGGGPKPEAVVKYASTPIAMLAGLWDNERRAWEMNRPSDPRPPVFIVVCKNTRIAQAIYEWIGENKPPSGIAPLNIEALRNTSGQVNTIRVDSKVVHETDTGEAKNDRSAWMRLMLDTVGKPEWPHDRQGRSIYPDRFEDLAAKLGKPLHPPGRDVRCIVSVGMLTEGWDCNTVTHIVGLRPFMSQLLCEQVVGRGLRRASYETVDKNGEQLLDEEIAKVFGVPFEIIPFKQSKAATRPTVKRYHIHALPEKSAFEIKFPRVEGYRQAIRNRVMVNWDSIASLTLDPLRIPPEVGMKANLPNNRGRPSLVGPGKLTKVDLNPYRAGRRLQELVFELASDLTRSYVNQPGCEAPAHVLFPQLARIVEQYLADKVRPLGQTNILDVFLSPYYGWAIECLAGAIKPDISHGEPPMVAVYETRRGPGSTSEVDLWTSREVREVSRSHLNYVVADTQQWEQSAAYFIDTHPLTDTFVKNSGLGFAIPYTYNGQSHDYVPDFVIRLKTEPPIHLILEVKGYDDLMEVKAQAARRWVEAVNAEESYGRWAYAVVNTPTKVADVIDQISQSGDVQQRL
jgi:type III restriction enzyme